MATYEYICSEDDGCGGITERVRSIHDPHVKTTDCAFCGKIATFKVSLSAISHSGMGNESFDIAVGKASAARHEEIAQRQVERNKVRRAAGQQGLKATGYNEFTPISTGQRKTRTRALGAIEKDGYKPEAFDKHLVG
jgi:hypothetical protein